MADTVNKGYKFIGTIKNIKGHCNAGHNIGDKFELSAHKTAGICGFFYNSIFPTLMTLQFGGHLPWFPNPDVIMLECPDKMNAVILELKRIKIE